MKAWMFVVIAAAAACGGSGAQGRIGYVVTAKDDTPAGRAHLHDALMGAIGASAAGDVSDDGFVVRLDDATRRRIAAMAEVGAVTPLDVAARLGPLPAGEGVVHVDLYDDATAAERDEIAAWIAAHGGSVRARGATWIDATMARPAAEAAARLPAVRWIEAR